MHTNSGNLEKQMMANERNCRYIIERQRSPFDIRLKMLELYY
jgi:hypothetical protein